MLRTHHGVFDLPLVSSIPPSRCKQIAPLAPVLKRLSNVTVYNLAEPRTLTIEATLLLRLMVEDPCLAALLLILFGHADLIADKHFGRGSVPAPRTSR
jgi:hypothetical protein